MFFALIFRQNSLLFLIWYFWFDDSNAVPQETTKDIYSGRVEKVHVVLFRFVRKEMD